MRELLYFFYFFIFFEKINTQRHATNFTQMSQYLLRKDKTNYTTHDVFVCLNPFNAYCLT